MTHNRLIQIVCVVFAIAMMGMTALLRPQIDAERKDFLPQVPLGDNTLPPAVALGTAALGSFRGLIVDALWYRAYKLKDDGKYYEANQLSHIITQLQPRFPQVWIFHAWNMAYNISVATHTPDERWYWVNSGIKLLREQGVPLNPDSPRIYKELAWILKHKVGDTADDMHWYYKRKLAEEWQEILGVPTEGATTEEAISAMRRIAEAPKGLGELLSQQPQVKPLWQYLSGLGYEPDVKLLRQIGAILMYNYSPDHDLWAQMGLSIPEQFDQRLDMIFRDADLGPGVEPLLAFLRKRVLTDTYRMDPQLMVEVMEQFGPLDWRHPSAQSCYWNHLGVKVITARHEQSEIPFINVYRARIHAIQDLAHRGKVSFDPRMPDPPDLLPDSRFIEMYERALDETIEYLTRIESDKGVFNSFETGHENFLLKFAVDAYMTGAIREAKQIYDKLRKLYGQKSHNKERYKLALHELILKEARDIDDIPYFVRSFCRNIIFKGIHLGLGGANPERFHDAIDTAGEFLDHYHKDKVATAQTAKNRQELGKLDEIVTETYIDYMSRPGYSIARRARVWKNTPDTALQLNRPLQLRHRTYDRLYRVFVRQFRDTPFNPELALPEPPGMDAYRKRTGQPGAPTDKPRKGTRTIETQ